MSKQAERKVEKRMGLVFGAATLGFLGLAAWGVSSIMGGEGPRERDQIRHVSLVQPPLPPLKQKLPEPEAQEAEAKPDPAAAKMDQTFTQAADAAPQSESAAPGPPGPPGPAGDGPPAGDQLGVDGDASGGAGDAFGLVARRGGRALTLGPGGGGGAGGGGGGLSRGQALLMKYGWYGRTIEEEINRRLAKMRDVPAGKYQTWVRIGLDDRGVVLDFSIYKSSGNPRMDEAVSLALNEARSSGEPLRQAPPEGMPRTLKVRVSSPS